MARGIGALMAAYVVASGLASAVLGLASPGSPGYLALLGAAPLLTVLLASRRYGLAYLAPAVLLAAVWASALAGLGLGG